MWESIGIKTILKTDSFAQKSDFLCNRVVGLRKFGAYFFDVCRVNWSIWLDVKYPQQAFARE